MVMPKVWLTETPLASVTRITKVEVPKTVGVPKIVIELLVLVESESPAGSFPETRDHVNVPSAPTAPMTPT